MKKIVLIILLRKCFTGVNWGIIFSLYFQEDRNLAPYCEPSNKTFSMRQLTFVKVNRKCRLYEAILKFYFRCRNRCHFLQVAFNKLMITETWAPIKTIAKRHITVKSINRCNGHGEVKISLSFHCWYLSHSLMFGLFLHCKHYRNEMKQSSKSLKSKVSACGVLTMLTRSQLLLFYRNLSKSLSYAKKMNQKLWTIITFK